MCCGWENELPTENWLVIPFGHTKDVKLISRLANVCLDKKVNYACTIGQTCELIHDIFDEEIVSRKYIEEQWDTSIYRDWDIWQVDISMFIFEHPK